MILFEGLETGTSPARGENETPRQTGTCQIIPVASGKGGVGKTFYSVNLGLSLAAHGKRTIIIDLDIGGSNLHTYLGMKNKNPGIGEYLTAKNTRLADFSQPTEYQNLWYVPGDQLIPDIANCTRTQRKKLITDISTLEDYDAVILDLGSGTGAGVTDFFLLSERGIVITMPTPGAIVNAFSLLKTVIYRLFRLTFTDRRLRRIITASRKRDKGGSFPSFWDILNEIAAIDRSAALKFRDLLGRFSPMLVYSMVEKTSDVDLLRSLTDLVYEKLIIEAEVLGHLPREGAAHSSIKNRTPLQAAFPTSRCAVHINTMADKLIAWRDEDKPLYDIHRYESSLEELSFAVKGDPVINPPPPAPEPSRKARRSRKELMKLSREIMNPFAALKRANEQIHQRALGFGTVNGRH